MKSNEVHIVLKNRNLADNFIVILKQKVLLYSILIIVGVIASGGVLFIKGQRVSAFSGSGDGTTTNPYRITNCSELQSIDTDVTSGSTSGKIYKLANDIDCSDTVNWNSADGFDPIGGGNSFDGTLDGAGYAISNLYINRSSQDYVGLFANASGSSIIANLNLSNVNITGRDYVGGVAGFSYGIMLGINVEGSISGASTGVSRGVGGVVGRLQNTSTSSKSLAFSGTVTNTGPETGGIVGTGSNARVENTYANATVTGNDYVGGVYGKIGACCSMIQNAYAEGSVSGDEYVGGIVGGIVGFSSVTVSDVFAASEITGNTNTGAVAGAIASHSGTNTISDFYFDQTAAGTSDCYASSSLAVSCTAQNTDGSDGGHFYNTANEPLASWDFTNDWSTVSGDYPVLRPLGELTGPSTVSNISVTFPNSPIQASVSFTESEDSGSFDINYYAAQIKQKDDTWSDVIANGTSGTSPISLSGLAVGATYTVRVQAVTAYGSSSWVEYEFTTPNANTHLLSTCEQLSNFDDSLNGTRLDTIILTQDIDCSGIDFEPLGYGVGWDGDPFMGTFDGRGHTIKNLTVNVTGDAGLFAETDKALLKNVTFKGGSITSDDDYVGALVGEADDTSVINVYSNLAVTSSDDGYVGGVIGFLEATDQTIDVLVEHVSSTGDVSGQDDVGGLIGEVEADGGKSITIRKSYATGDVTNVFADYYSNFGGLIGNLQAIGNDDGETSTVTVEDVYARGNVIAGAYDVGGLIGRVESDSDGYSDTNMNVIIQRAYAIGDVAISASYDDVGGLIGSIQDLYYAQDTIRLENTFAAGAVSGQGNYIGGLVGYYNVDAAQISSNNNYFDTNGGALDCNDDATGDPIPNCTGINEASQPNYFKGNSSNSPLNNWDFTSVWQANANDYPTLRPVADQDNDGVDNAIENAGPNNGDANNDGIQDASQAHVAAFVSVENQQYIAVELDVQCALTTVQSSKELAQNVQDSGFDYQAGLVSFTADCLTPGYTTTAKLYHYNLNASNAVVRKHNPGTNAYFNLTGIYGATIQETTIGGLPVGIAAYQITDGTDLDIDGSENGIIVDPVGIASQTVGSPNTGLETTNATKRSL